MKRREMLQGAGATLAICAAGAVPARASVRSGATRTPDFDGYIQDVLAVGDVPGASVVVVHQGSTVFSRAYGINRLGQADRVDLDTVFDTASLTKSFTAAAIASLVDEGRMAWDDPVRKHLPTLEFPNPYLTAELTVRDLLCHRTGLSNLDSAWYLTGISRNDVLGLVKNLEVSAPLRTKWLYSNIGFTIAGEAAASAAGMSWERLVTERLLTPLGMRRSTANFDAVPTLGNFASPHAIIGTNQVVIPRETQRASTAPAGGVQSCATDIATWMNFHLGDGTHAGRRILSVASMAEMHSPQIVVPTTAAFRAARQLRYFAGYGLGWQVFDYRGRPYIWHTGGGDGQRAIMALLPDQSLGVAVLVNSKSAPIQSCLAIVSHIFDHYLGEQPAQDYLDDVRTAFDRSNAERDTELAARAASRDSSKPPNAPMSAYVGRYRDRLGLIVDVTEARGDLTMRYGGGELAILDHWRDDLFFTRWQNPMHSQNWGAFLSFSLNASGIADRLHFEPDQPVDAIRI